MAFNAHRFSQIRDDLSQTSIAGVFAKGRCRSSTGSAQDCTRAFKRRRTSGLNARFDNMVRSMDVTYPGPQNLRQLRTRKRSSSDASHLSSTISDAYSDLHEGRIGENFTLVKMQPSTDSSAGRMQTQVPCGGSQNRSEYTPSFRKDLPEWLHSTFSNLSEKHPLRSLLPNKSYCPQTGANDDPKTDPAFAFGIDRITQINSHDLPEGDFIGITSDKHHAFCSVPRSPTSLEIYSLESMDNVPQFQSLSAACGDLDAVSISTPGPKTVSVRQSPTTFEWNEVNERDPDPASEFKGPAFIPFSTPGPASTLGSYMATNSFSPISDSHTSNCLVDTDIEASACFARHIATTFPIPHSRHTSNESSAIDSSLPPYRAATSDPAPAYSSDGIYDDAYYADPSKNEPGSEPLALPLRTNDNFATPGLEYCAPRSIFFDSPTEEPSILARSKPGYEIDLDAIDFKWTPFNRKSAEEKKLTPCDQRQSESCNNLVPEYSEMGVNCTVISRAGSPGTTLLPDSLPSPSPFRFTLHQLTTNTDSTFNHAEPQTPQSSKLAQAFAPAPGIYVSPLHDEMETQTSVPRTPQDQIIRTELIQPDLSVKTEFPDSQGSCDSIESWRDADEGCP